MDRDQQIDFSDLISEETLHPDKEAQQRPSKKKANDLDGRTWTQYSISIWSDIHKSREELAFDHPAIFPEALVRRLIECFTTSEELVVLDPFAGSGSTVVTAQRMGKRGIGFEIYGEFVQFARQRLAQKALWSPGGGETTIIQADANRLQEYLPPESVDLVITSPPYWDILSQRRTADRKEIRDYGEAEADLAKIPDYAQFLLALKRVFEQVYIVLRPGKYCIVIVMDIRKKNRFYPFHSDIASFMQEIGFIFDDIIIWDRRHEYNNMRPLGYPYVFRVNKAHEFILIFKKP